MYFEFESSVVPMSTHTTHQTYASSGSNHSNHNNNFGSQPLLRARHRRLSSSSQSLSELFSEENIIENITPSQCDLYLITRKKLSAITTSDLRREVLLASFHRNITGNSSKCSSSGNYSLNSESTKDKMTRNDQQQHHELSNYQRNQFKSGLNSSTTSTSTTTIANTMNSTKLTSTNMTVTTHSSQHKKRSSSSSSTSSTCSSPSSPPSSSDYEEEWKTTIKRLKVVHGLDFNLDVAMDSEFEEHCDSDLNDLTNNFHRLKTPFK